MPCASAAAAEAPLEFEKDIRPLLAEHCFRCHGPEKQEAGVRLDVKAEALKPIDEERRAAVLPGEAAKSPILQLASNGHAGAPTLATEQVEQLRRWIETGAHWTDPEAPAPSDEKPSRTITEADKQFWSFIPPKLTPIESLAVPDASWCRTSIDRHILYRLHTRNLRPTTEAPPEVLIRRLTFDLTGLPPTPAEVEVFLNDRGAGAYGRLVGRLVESPRFGERMASLWLPLARYAEDQAHQVGDDTKFFYPHAWKYRKWVIDAFNRDLPYDKFVQYQLAADKIDGASGDDLAALGLIGLGPKYYDRKRTEVQADEWEDRVDTVSRTFLGLTVACARCHDHKFDPVTQVDYYALAGVFASTNLVNRVPGGETQKGELEAPKVNPAAVHAVEDAEKPRELHVFVRGAVDRPGEVAPRRFLAVLSQGEPAPFKEGSGRKELAMAIADPQNPLTARVMVNRVWGMLFGAYLVSTPSNFGHSGQPPANQQLLDDLAARFVQNGWSVKWLVREIVTSATYRQSSLRNPQGEAADPANELLWRMNRKRLSVEQWRDTALFVAGNLDPETTGPSQELTDPKNLRRTVYARISRLKLNDLLMQFDYPDANVHAEKRAVTATPAQKLFLLNGKFPIEQAKALAARIKVEAPQDDAARARLAYRLVFAREPDDEERSLAVEFLKGDGAADLSRLEQYMQALLASNEAMYLD